MKVIKISFLILSSRLRKEARRKTKTPTISSNSNNRISKPAETPNLLRITLKKIITLGQLVKIMERLSIQSECLSINSPPMNRTWIHLIEETRETLYLNRNSIWKYNRLINKTWWINHSQSPWTEVWNGKIIFFSDLFNINS